MKNSNSIIANAISRLKILDLYDYSLENLKKLNLSENNRLQRKMQAKQTPWSVMYSVPSKSRTLVVKKLVFQSHHINKNTSNTVELSADGILETQQYIYCLKYGITIELHSIVPIILHEFTILKVIKELSVYLRP